MKDETLPALAKGETVVAPLESSANEHTAWLEIRWLLSKTENGELQYRIRIIELHNKYLLAYEDGKEVNPEELAIRYEVVYATGEEELKGRIIRFLANTDKLVRYDQSTIRYPH